MEAIVRTILLSDIMAFIVDSQRAQTSSQVGQYFVQLQTTFFSPRMWTTYFLFSQNQQFSKLNLVIKIDIEGRECDMIAGSEKSFLENDLYFVPIIFMEWRFNEFATNVCGKEKLKASEKTWNQND